MIGVAVCTHNPDERLLARTLTAIESQTVLPSECIIVDNRSAAPVASIPCVAEFLSRCTWARVLVESRPGLSNARVCAIENTSAPWLCFVDDDNEPDRTYLEEAQKILECHSCIGALGPGSVIVDYIDPVPDWFRDRFGHHFQEKSTAGLSYGSVAGTWTDYYPPGSCMTVRREILQRYRSEFLAGTLSASDRVGTSLSSGGDTQIVWEAVKMGFAAGISSTLQIRHVVPAKRSTLEYIKRLCFGTASSYLPVLVSSFPDQRSTLPQPPSDGRITATVFRIVLRHVRRRTIRFLSIEIATYLGSIVGLVRLTGQRRPWLERWVSLLRLP
jgi:hypothetical protein